MKKGYILTEKQASEVFFIVSTARIKLNGKAQTLADKHFKEMEEALGLNPMKDSQNINKASLEVKNWW